MKKYPTKKEILECETKPTTKEIEIIKEWKKKVWEKRKTNYNIEKIEALVELIKKLDTQKQIKFIDYKKKANSASYNKKKKTIIIKDTSIISILHEFAHMIHGDSELKACSWSIKLFKISFTVAFKKLHWEGHMLKK